MQHSDTSDPEGSLRVDRGGQTESLSWRLCFCQGLSRLHLCYTSHSPEIDGYNGLLLSKILCRLFVLSLRLDVHL